MTNGRDYLLESSMNPLCSACNKSLWAGEPVQKQGGPHILCNDPGLLHHRRLVKFTSYPPTYMQLGFLDESGNAVWM